MDAALRRYSDCVLRTDSAGIAKLFAPDGVVANPGRPNIVGPAAVKKFLEQFKDFKVQAYTIESKRTSVTGAIAEQVGTYRQRVRLPKKKVIEVSGRFRTVWTHTNDGRWLIRRMETTPDP
ncbi:MAG: nuclear transport factor 2 family protein [Verrucomicrobiota bacterium]|nr:nuclear transport factor 2 family protein [Verrucomicrobiota bacterium]